MLINITEEYLRQSMNPFMHILLRTLPPMYGTDDLSEFENMLTHTKERSIRGTFVYVFGPRIRAAGIHDALESVVQEHHFLVTSAHTTVKAVWSKNCTKELEYANSVYGLLSGAEISVPCIHMWHQPDESPTYEIFNIKKYRQGARPHLIRDLLPQVT
jgi:hypothetical protein